MLFKFEGMDQNGTEIKDELEAESKESALALIKQMGFFPTKLSQSKAKPKAKKKTPISGASGYSYPPSGYSCPSEPEVPKNKFFQLDGMDSHSAFLNGLYTGIVGIIAVEVVGLLLWLIL
ncbi:MAG: hypothetical protein M0R80_00735 [Proteobacteria bacterium]|jgi:hypothetical protein|nr:hypothetical protein [Pseudomonadota bacterium]